MSCVTGSKWRTKSTSGTNACEVWFGKLGLMPAAGLLHRNQTLCPTRTTPSGLCTGVPAPAAPIQFSVEPNRILPQNAVSQDLDGSAGRSHVRIAEFTAK
jgi:hypothetical protein